MTRICPGSGEPWRLGVTEAPLCPGCGGLPSIIGVEDPGRLWQVQVVPEHAPRDLSRVPPETRAKLPASHPEYQEGSRP